MGFRLLRRVLLEVKSLGLGGMSLVGIQGEEIYSIGLISKQLGGYK